MGCRTPIVRWHAPNLESLYLEIASFERLYSWNLGHRLPLLCEIINSVVRPQGLEPRFSGSEPDVLPLHHGRLEKSDRYGIMALRQLQTGYQRRTINPQHHTSSSPPCTQCCIPYRILLAFGDVAPSSSGLGRWPLTPETWVRVPLGSPQSCMSVVALA